MKKQTRKPHKAKSKRKAGNSSTSRKDNRLVASHKTKKRSFSKLVREVLNLFSFHRTEALSLADIYQALRAKSATERAIVKRIVETLLEQDKITRAENGKYSMPLAEETISAIYQWEKGEGYALPTEEGPIIHISDRRSLGARHGDHVEVIVLAEKRGIVKGEVVAITQLAKEEFLGVVREVDAHTALVESYDKLFSKEGIIVSSDKKQLAQGDKVLVKVTEWNTPATQAKGVLVANFGKEGDNDAEMHAILSEFGLPYSYPSHCEAMAAKIPDEIPSQEREKREDFTAVTTLTIDPEDAKDFDDAISIKSLDEDFVEVGVHIADVTHYVRQGDEIDQEAYHRATSVYLVDRTVPMLPERLSNVICSLRPNEEKLCFSVVFKLAKKDASIKDYRIVKSIIQSNRRFTYEEAQQLIDTEQGDFAEELVCLNKLAQLLREQRFQQGGIRFHSTELRFVLDDKGRPLDVSPVVHGTANELIEEFMLLANRTVAERIGKKKKSDSEAPPFVYRIHENPDPDKLSAASKFLQKSNIIDRKKKKEEKLTTERINTLLDSTTGTPFESLVSMLILKAMARATYSTDNIGHFGLAFPFYTHFTSPIRRYPDMMVHRLLTKYLAGESAGVKQEELEEKCKHCSDREKLAENADRASVKYKQAEYLENKKSKVFDGYITGITDWGLYVTLNHSGCEGLVPIRQLDDDFYTLDERSFSLVGRRYKRRYTLGQPIRVRVTATDKLRRLIDFDIVE